MELDYKALAALDAVVEHGSFERAAVALSISQPAVSHRLRALEEQAGELLLVRGQPPQATACGQRLIAHYRQVRLLEAGLEPDPGQGARLPTLAIAVNADSAATWLLEALAGVLRTPSCLVDVLIDDQDQTLRHLRQGRVVGCVTSSPETAAGTAAVALGIMRYRCVAAPAFVARWFPDGMDAGAVLRAPALLFNRSDTLHQRYLRGLGLPDVVPHHLFPSAHGFVAFLAAGHGYGMVPAIQVGEELAAGTLVEVVPGTELAVPLYWQHWSITTPLTRALTDAIVAAAARRLEPAP